MTERKPYPSNPSDARWALIEPILTAWRKARLDRRPTSQPPKVELRDVFNAILCINRTGIPWKYLPHDFPNHGTVYAYYAAWRDEGIFAQLNYDSPARPASEKGASPILHRAGQQLRWHLQPGEDPLADLGRGHLPASVPDRGHVRLGEPDQRAERNSIAPAPGPPASCPDGTTGQVRSLSVS